MDTRPKERTKISRERMEREVKQAVTRNQKTAKINLSTIVKMKSTLWSLTRHPTLHHSQVNLITTKAVLMKATREIKATRRKIKMHLVCLKLYLGNHWMLRPQKKGVTITSDHSLKKTKKMSRVKIKTKTISTMKTALTVTETVLKMTRMEMDLAHLHLATPLPADHSSNTTWISMRYLLATKSITSKIMSLCSYSEVLFRPPPPVYTLIKIAERSGDLER